MQDSESETKNTNQKILYEEKVVQRDQGRCPEEKPSSRLNQIRGPEFLPVDAARARTQPETLSG